MDSEAVAKPGSPSAEADAWRELNLLLLRAAVDHAVRCNAAEFEAFQQRSREAMRELKEHNSSSEILIAAGAVAESLAHYNKHTQEQVDALAGESRSVLEKFVSHLTSIYDDPQSEQTLQDLRAAVAEPPTAAAQRKVEECLNRLSQEAADRSRQARELADRLQDRVTILEQTISSPASTPAPNVAANAAVDPCTGLAVRAEGEAAIRRAVSEGTPGYVAVFYLHRMALTNARFGEAIGNQVIMFASQHLATAIARQNDQMFRWTGPAFVAVLERVEAMLTVNNEVQRTISSPISRFFETPTRSVYLPIKITGDIVPLEGNSYAEVADKIERFILTASGNSAGD